MGTKSVFHRLRAASMLALPLFLFGSCDSGGPTELSQDDLGQVFLQSSGDPVGPVVVGESVTIEVQAFSTLSGKSLKGVAVYFTPGAPGHGQVSPNPARADKNGNVVAQWQVGVLAGEAMTMAASLQPGGTAGGANPFFQVVPVADVAAKAEIHGGDHQTIPPGTEAIYPFQVLVTDQYGNPVAGESVSWTAGAEATATPESSVTAEDGIAQTRLYVSSNALGSLATTAQVQDMTPLIFETTVVESSNLVPATIFVVQNVGTMTVGEISPWIAAGVLDKDGYPVEGVRVDFKVSKGGGLVEYPWVLTGPDGIAQNRWQLGTKAGEQRLTATVPGIAETVFTAQSKPGEPATVQAREGGGQEGVVGDTLPEPYVVKVLDEFGNPVPAVEVTWAVVSGGGAMSPAYQITDELGQIRGTHVLGPQAGAQTVEARLESGSAALFYADAMAGPPAIIGIEDGDEQVALPGDTLQQRLVVHVTDEYGNPVFGAGVSWAALVGNGAMTPMQSESDSTGLAETRYTMGSSFGTQEVQAALDGTSADTVFTVYAVNADLEVVNGDEQEGTVDTPLSEVLAIRVIDVSTGEAVPNVIVRFEVGEGGGSVAPERMTTQSTGIAFTTRTLGPKIGVHTTLAIFGPDTLTFTSTARGANDEDRMRVVSGDQQYGIGGQPLPEPFKLRVLTLDGAPAPGVDIAWSVAEGDEGVINSSSSTTDDEGYAEAQATLPPTVGSSMRVIARAAALSDSLVFTAHVQASPQPASIALLAGNEQSAFPGDFLPEVLQVIVLGPTGAPVPNVTVHWAVGGGGGSIAALTSTTSPEGVATMRRRLGLQSGTYTTTASVPGLSGSPVIFTSFAVSGNDGFTVEPVPSSNHQKGIVDEDLIEPLQVRVLDGTRSAVGGVVVSWRVLSGGGSVATSTSVTGDDGVASMTYRLGSLKTDLHQVEASVHFGEAATTLSAIATGVPTSIEIVGDTTITAVAGEIMRAPFILMLRDADGDPVRGAGVIWTVAAGSASLSEEAEFTSGRKSLTTTTKTDGMSSVWVSAPGAPDGTIEISANVLNYSTIPNLIFYGQY